MYTNWTSVTKAIIGASIFSMLASVFTLNGVSIISWMAYNPHSAVSHLEIWRFLTYALAHGGLYGVLANFIPFFLLAEPVERQVGGPNLFLSYATSVICGAILFTIADFNYDGFYIGAVGGVYGVAMIYSIIFPNSFVLWHRLKVKFIIWLFAFTAILACILGSPQWVPVGGILAGTFFGFYFKSRLVVSPSQSGAA